VVSTGPGGFYTWSLQVLVVSTPPGLYRSWWSLQVLVSTPPGLYRSWWSLHLLVSRGPGGFYRSWWFLYVLLVLRELCHYLLEDCPTGGDEGGHGILTYFLVQVNEITWEVGASQVRLD